MKPRDDEVVTHTRGTDWHPMKPRDDYVVTHTTHGIAPNLATTPSSRTHEGRSTSMTSLRDVTTIPNETDPSTKSMSNERSNSISSLRDEEQAPNRSSISHLR